MKFSKYFLAWRLSNLESCNWFHNRPCSHLFFPGNNNVLYWTDSDSMPCSVPFSRFFYWQQSLNLCSLSLCSSIRHLCLYPPGKTTSPTLPPPRRWVSASSFTPLTCHLKSPLPAAAISFLLKWWIAAEKKKKNFRCLKHQRFMLGFYIYIYIY